MQKAVMFLAQEGNWGGATKKIGWFLDNVVSTKITYMGFRGCNVKKLLMHLKHLEDAAEDGN